MTLYENKRMNSISSINSISTLVALRAEAEKEEIKISSLLDNKAIPLYEGRARLRGAKRHVSEISKRILYLQKRESLRMLRSSKRKENNDVVKILAREMVRANKNQKNQKNKNQKTLSTLNSNKRPLIDFPSDSAPSTINSNKPESIDIYMVVDKEDEFMRRAIDEAREGKISPSKIWEVAELYRRAVTSEKENEEIWKALHFNS